MFLIYTQCNKNDRATVRTNMQHTKYYNRLGSWIHGHDLTGCLSVPYLSNIAYTAGKQALEKLVRFSSSNTPDCLQLPGPRKNAEFRALFSYIVLLVVLGKLSLLKT